MLQIKRHTFSDFDHRDWNKLIDGASQRPALALHQQSQMNHTHLQPTEISIHFATSVGNSSPFAFDSLKSAWLLREAGTLHILPTIVASVIFGITLGMAAFFAFLGTDYFQFAAALALFSIWFGAGRIFSAPGKIEVIRYVEMHRSKKAT